MNTPIKSSDRNNNDDKSNNAIAGKQKIIELKPIETTQIQITIDNCKVKLNFPMVSIDSVMKDIARIMIGTMVSE